MLLPIPIGYFVATFLLVSGLLNCMEYLNNKPENCSRAVLLNGLAEAGWPIIAASVILLLIQLNRQMEKLRLEATTSPAPSLPKPGKKKKRVTEEAEAAPSASKEPPAPQPAPVVNLAGLATPIQPIVRSQVATPAASSAHTPLYPNSPIPGGGRVPQQITAPPTPPEPAADMPPRPTPEPSARAAKRAPNKAEAESLSFFKVD